MKKAEILETLRAMQKNLYDLSDKYEADGDKDFAKKLFREGMGIGTALMMFERPAFAQKMRDIFID